ncbi:hypothetical protein FRB95_010794 [Tulasnella sp. JGI-2019a]|nr:hypothetical protein FRB95_010794 [Tulasnella sp. JGI-2019a]
MEGFTHAKENVLLKLINEILLLAFLATDIFCIARGVHGHRNDSFLTASTMTFGVWVVILILFIGTLVYQWTDRGKKSIAETNIKLFDDISIHAPKLHPPSTNGTIIRQCGRRNRELIDT